MVDYNLWMAAVDGFKQKRNAYTSDRSSKKSLHRIFYFLFDAAVVNAFIQHNANNDISYVWFRLVLGRQLTNGHTFRHYTRTASFRKNKQGQKNGQKMESRMKSDSQETTTIHEKESHSEGADGVQKLEIRSAQSSHVELARYCSVPLVLVPFTLSKHASKIRKVPSRDNGTVLSHFSTGTEYTNETYTSHFFLINYGINLKFLAYHF